MFQWISKWLGALALLSVSLLAQAADQAIPSCYEGKMAEIKTIPSKELFVIIDQTVVLDAGLRQSVANQLRPFLVPGNAFSVFSFSAFTQGKYTELLTSGLLENVIGEKWRRDISKPLLSKMDLCMSQQPVLAGQAAGAALRQAFGGASDAIAKSDVMASLRDISTRVRQSKANQKIVLVVSDMLENSSVTSFYGPIHSVRKIEPERELKLAADNQLLANFAGARIFVIGAGLINADANKSKAAYRDPKTMQALNTFWRGYFDKSQAQLIEFGQPALLNPIQ